MARLKVGQKTCTGATIQVTSTPTETNYWMIKAPLTNTGSIEVGFSDLTSGNGFLLEPGDFLEYTAQRTSGENVYDTELTQIYILGAAPNKVSWLAHQV